MDDREEMNGTEPEAVETREWMESFDYVMESGGRERAARLLRKLQIRAQGSGVKLPFSATTPYVNTIPADQQPPYPGNREIERRIKSLIRWNAMAMVVRANRRATGHRRPHLDLRLGRHAVRGRLQPFLPRQGSPNATATSSTSRATPLPGIYARAFLEGAARPRAARELPPRTDAGGGLSSYPHPWLMPDFWEFPTVSMGLGPIMAIYQARFNRYLEDRGLRSRRPTPRSGRSSATAKPTSRNRSGAITLAAREKLDNLIFVINCNLQRLDGPVRGNGKIIQELEAVFRGAGWNVIKVIWGGDWDPLLGQGPATACWCKRMDEIVDGEYQKYAVESGAYIREHFFGDGSAAARDGQAPVRRAAPEAAARRPRSRKGLRRLQGRRRAQGLADRHPGQDDQGLRAGRRRAKARTSRTSRRS